MSGHSHKSISKLRRVICRVSSCKKSIVLQNYSDHLRSAHPAENFKDLRAAGDRGIASFGFTTTGSSEEGRGAAVTNPVCSIYRQFFVLLQTLCFYLDSFLYCYKPCVSSYRPFFVPRHVNRSLVRLAALLSRVKGRSVCSTLSSVGLYFIHSTPWSLLSALLLSIVKCV
jgi:hypothetical protein